MVIVALDLAPLDDLESLAYIASSTFTALFRGTSMISHVQLNQR